MMSFAHIAAITTGAVSHVLYFNRGEHHFYGARYLQAFATAFVAAIIILCQQGQAADKALAQVTTIAFFYLIGLYTSLITYRSLFHPLNTFSGPFGARISDLWLSAQLRNGDAFREVQKLHENYGDFVRAGSSSLSITHPKAVNAIYGLGSKCTKSAFYDLNKPTLSLQTLRIKALHDQRRRTWAPAFSDKAVRGYEERIKKYRNTLVAQIETFNGQPVNVSKWFTLYNFDITGDLAYGTSFEMLETGEEHWAVKLLNEGMAPLAWMFPAWFFRFMAATPGLMRDWFRFLDYCAQKLDERMNSKVDIPDIMATLLEPLNGLKPKPKELDMLRGDARLIVVAGSDTTAATLTTIMLELARHPEHLRKLRKELGPYMLDPTADVSNQEIVNLDHLNGVIYEALRMYPPVPTAIPRITPPEGLEIGEVHIPGNMNVWCPQYVLGRKEEIYTQANEFVPERWYLYPDMVKEKSAWAPFSTGPYGCIGRSLAMMNLRTTVARLVMGFDINFPPTDDDHGKTFEAKTIDHFTLGLAELKLCFEKRRLVTA